MSWIKNYKEKECKTWIGKFFQRLFFTWTYKIIAAVVLVIIASIAFNFTNDGSFWDSIASSIFAVGFCTIIIIAIIFIVFAWIINPIMSVVKKNKEKKDL